ncbi:MAG: hypothetical protein IKJ88_07860 [Clostridia bacterium]|nr:hypothetical protein [Clostridia bacterium]
MTNIKNKQYLTTAEIANRLGVGLEDVKMVIPVLKETEQLLGIESPEGQLSIIAMMEYEEFLKNETNRAINKEKMKNIIMNNDRSSAFTFLDLRLQAILDDLTAISEDESDYEDMPAALSDSEEADISKYTISHLTGCIDEFLDILNELEDLINYRD